MRLTAIKVPIGLLFKGEFIKSTEQYKPSYIEVNSMKIARVHIMGVVIDKYTSENSEYVALTIDDGTGRIRFKLFGEETRFADGIDVNDFVRAIGKIRENENERYIVGEIVKKVDKGWQRLWKVGVMDKYNNLIQESSTPNEENREEDKGEGEESLNEGSEETSEKVEEKVLKGETENDETDGLLDVEEIDIDV